MLSSVLPSTVTTLVPVPSASQGESDTGPWIPVFISNMEEVIVRNPGKVPDNNFSLSGTPLKCAGWPCLWVLAFCDGCWRAVQWRKKPESKIFFLAVAHFRYYFPANSDSSLTKVHSLKTTGSPQLLAKTLALLVPH